MGVPVIAQLTALVLGFLTLYHYVTRYLESQVCRSLVEGCQIDSNPKI